MMASSEAEIPSEPASESSAAMDAKAKREARKARILSSGTDRLARITKTGRGSEADLLYNESPKGTRVGPYPAQTVDLDTSISQDDERMLKRTQVAMQGGVLPSSDDDPGEIDIGQQQRIDASNSAGSNPFMMGGQQQEGMPQDLAGMMQMMQKAMMGGGGGPPGPNGQGIDTQQGGVPFSFPFGPPGPAETSTPPASRKFDVLESAFNFLRILVFVVFGLALVYGALSGRASATSFVPEDENSAIVEKFAHMTTLDRWARLAYERPAHWEARYFGVESFGLPIHGIVSLIPRRLCLSSELGTVHLQPVFWLFITLEIALQSSRIMLHRVSLKRHHLVELGY
jgi:hypothetical protein